MGRPTLPIEDQRKHSTRVTETNVERSRIDDIAAHLGCKSRADAYRRAALAFWEVMDD